MVIKQYNIELSDEAEADLDDSYNYYNEISFSVADTFIKQIGLSFDFIKQNPEVSPVILRSLRKFVVVRFPFVIYYRLIEETIQVVAIFHTSRNPKIWNERLNK